ncbi:MAG TPA: PilZ domain-containing protein [Terriglobales bacterium]|nr:PilZ domain-containing protein [Terriglobales bacterium]
MSSSDNATNGADWTHLLSDPDLVSHLGELLQAYRDAPTDKRDQVLLEAMRKIKTSSAKSEKADDTSRSAAVPVAAKATPPFDPDEVSSFWLSPSAHDRRQHPRMKCFVAVEMRVEGVDAPLWGNLADTSLGGCFIETASPVENGMSLRIGLWLANGQLWVKGMVLNGIVTRSSPCFGVRVKFTGLDSAERGTLRQFIKFIENSMSQFQNEQGYLARLKG